MLKEPFVILLEIGIDLQIFNTAINEYMKRKDKNLILLSEYATKFKIEKILAQYMEVLGWKEMQWV